MIAWLWAESWANGWQTVNGENGDANHYQATAGWDPGSRIARRPGGGWGRGSGLSGIWTEGTEIQDHFLKPSVIIFSEKFLTLKSQIRDNRASIQEGDTMDYLIAAVIGAAAGVVLAAVLIVFHILYKDDN